VRTPAGTYVDISGVYLFISDEHSYHEGTSRRPPSSAGGNVASATGVSREASESFRFACIVCTWTLSGQGTALIRIIIKRTVVTKRNNVHVSESHRVFVDRVVGRQRTMVVECHMLRVAIGFACDEVGYVDGSATANLLGCLRSVQGADSDSAHWHDSDNDRGVLCKVGKS
jgi:hypothetical protein